MSRSKKKNPFVDFACAGRHAMKKWKKQQNRKIRRMSNYLYSGSYYRKVNNAWDAPNDGKFDASKYTIYKSWKVWGK
jgi:hypothetical protein